MKTKFTTLYTVLAACTSLLWSCADEPGGMHSDASRHILFDGPTMSLQSSGSRGIESAIGSDFAVYGYCAPQEVSRPEVINWSSAGAGWNDKSALVVPRVFSGQAVGPDGSYSLPGGGLREWEKHPLYDENTFKYTFIAYYPADGGLFDMNRKMYAEGSTAAEIAASVGVPELRFTMPYSGADTEADLSTDVPDAMVAAVFDHRKNGQPVKFRFEHVMTAFRFMINNYTNLRLEVKKVELKGRFFRSTVINYRSTTPTYSVTADDMYAGTYRLLESSQFVAAQGDAGEYLGASEQNNNEGVTVQLLPGHNTENVLNYDYLGEDIRLVMDYSLYELGTTTPVSEYTGVEVNFMPSRPKAGVRYTVNLNYLGNEFVLVFLPDTDVWEGDHDNDIIIN